MSEIDHPTAADMANKYQRDAAWWREEAGRLEQALQAIADCDLSDPADYVRRCDAIAVEALARYSCATGAA